MPTDLPAPAVASAPLDHLALHRAARRARDRAISDAFAASARWVMVRIGGIGAKPAPRLG